MTAKPRPAAGGGPLGWTQRYAAGHQFGDDLGGDFIIEARPVVAGTR